MKKLLLIDENQELLEAMKILLTLNGYTTEVSIKSLMIKEVIAEFNPDIIIMDHDCRSNDDKLFCEILGSANNSENVPLLLLTNKEGYFDYNKYGYKNFVAVDFLKKPFEMLTLQNKLQKIFSLT